MSCKLTFRMDGFNPEQWNRERHRTVVLEEDFEYYYANHPVIESVWMSRIFDRMEFTLLPGIQCEKGEVYQKVVEELERLCFNLIAYAGVETNCPKCRLETIKDEEGNKLQVRDSIGFRESIQIRSSMDKETIRKCLMEPKTPIEEHYADYKEIFYILHNPHKCIQFMGLYDVLIHLICQDKENLKQKNVHDFFGRNKEKYAFIHFYQDSKNKKQGEDTFTHLRNKLAHSKSSGAEEFLKAAESITDREISQILQVINDILSGEIPVK